MKIFGILFKLFILFTFFSVLGLANTNRMGSLSSGMEVLLTPQNQHALSITRTAGKYASDANFNFTMLNGNEVIYEDKNQVDDVYLVFHDDIQKNDRIKIHVNSGYFDYKIAPLLSLPKVVKNVIDPEVIEKAKRYEAQEKRSRKKSIQQQQKRIEKKSKKVEDRSRKEVQKIAPAITTPKVVEKVEEYPLPNSTQQTVNTSSVNPLDENFFTHFTAIFKKLLETLSLKPIQKNIEDKSLTTTISKSEEIKKAPTPVSVKPDLPTFDDKALKRAVAQTEKAYMPIQYRPNINANDHAIKAAANLEKSAFTRPKRGIHEKFDDDTLQENAKSEGRDFSKRKEPMISDTLPNQLDKSYHDSFKSGIKSDFKEIKIAKEQIPTFSSDVGVKEPVSVSQTPIETLPTFSDIKPELSPAPAIETSTPVVEKVAMPSISTPSVQKPTYIEDKKVAYPDTGYKDAYKDLAPKPQQVQNLQSIPHTAVKEDLTLPSQNKTTVPEEGEDKRLVIRKIIDKKVTKEDPYAGRILGNIDDRVLGNGYQPATSSAKLGMKVTKNNRPVSAWVEVFKNGTKQRVKTFYTAKSSRIKKVSLPAGTYMVRATYRTRDSKQQRTIKNIHLREGASINKSIAFYDGKVRVVARRGEKALYVKVIAYKSGTDRRVSYDFSARHSGVATLSLPSGRYDIEVLEHGKSRFFDNVRIRAGKITTLHADF